jgi:uncharacterized membrane protein
MVKQDWRYLLFLLVAHHPKEKLDHTIGVGFGNKKVHFCSRCTGLAFGMATIFATHLFGFGFSFSWYLPLIGLLPLAAIADWFTQSAGLRQSRTSLRVGSGFLLGISEALCVLLLFNGFFLSFLVAFGMAGAYALAVYLVARKTKCLDFYLKEMNQFEGKSDLN